MSVHSILRRHVVHLLDLERRDVDARRDELAVRLDRAVPVLLRAVELAGSVIDRTEVRERHRLLRRVALHVRRLLVRLLGVVIQVAALIA